MKTWMFESELEFYQFIYVSNSCIWLIVGLGNFSLNCHTDAEAGVGVGKGFVRAMKARCMNQDDDEYWWW